MKDFDPLLLNSFGTQKERITHRYIFIILNYAPLVLGIVGLIHSFKYPFPPTFLTLLNICFGLYCVIFLYANILLYQNGHTQRKRDSTKALLICKKRIKFYDYSGLVFLTLFYLVGLLISLSLFLVIFSLWLWYLYFAKPFLLKEVLLYEDCLIVRYRIYGDITLNLQNLALVGEGLGIGVNQTLARVKFNKKKKAIETYQILGNIDNDMLGRLENKTQLKEALYQKLGFNVDNISYASQFGLNRTMREE
ncbi:hypothetical protein OQH61_05800 [Helicobacter sp. MIT 21-1697]|uniref:hypothetical protein n=1 Tax=Helicobacter sp. MIT 21-1697 TaxID=2993733 RepID=UPI00224A89F9|nr:hypothetical protein [Helicobacter sp. MIT 21-1697]MCX2717248.1 hypothetical protein [Helicobacter sp. MIT 21-1697]